ncbi:MAG: HAD-IIIA family hydrolase, partial [Candidatus Jorgensenbacteria bacterium]
LLKDEFLLMYCDNYWPLRLKELCRFHREHKMPATVTVYTNKHGVTKNNVRVDENGLVAFYDKTRTATGLNGVDIGFFILKKDVLKLAPDYNFSFEKEILPKLIAKKQLVGYLTCHRYYSISSPDRLSLTAEFLSGKKIVLLDRDGVINKRALKADYIKTWSEFEFLPGSIEAIKMLSDDGYEIYVITNQPGVARGMMTKESLDEINQKMKEELKKNGADINGLYQCLHGWNDGCDCRKPKPGLLYEAAFENDFDLTKAVFIGDDERDLEAGEAAGCRTILLKPGQGLLDVAKSLIKN